MLTALSELGAEVYGVDPFGYEYLKERGFKVYRTLKDLPTELAFDGIITIQVMEHLPAPWVEIEQFHRLLADDGWLYVCTLNARGLNALISRSKWREVEKVGHILFFTPNSVEDILRKCRFTHFKRLRWLIGYSRNPIRRFAQYMLQILHLDGELRYLAWKSTNGR